jgi:hypothetical protein
MVATKPAAAARPPQIKLSGSGQRQEFLTLVREDIEYAGDVGVIGGHQRGTVYAERSYVGALVLGPIPGATRLRAVVDGFALSGLDLTRPARFRRSSARTWAQAESGPAAGEKRPGSRGRSATSSTTRP